MAKNGKLTALFAALLCAALLLSACGSAPAPASPEAPESASPGYVVDPEYVVDTEGELPEVPQDFLTKAMDAYSWFEMNLLGKLDDMPSKTTLYAYLVEDPEFRSYQAFCEYLLELFSPKIVRELLDRGYYKEENGMTYVCIHHRGTDKAVIRADIDNGRIEGRKLIYTASVTFADPVTLEPTGDATFEFIAEPVGGRFVFTEFPYFY